MSGYEDVNGPEVFIRFLYGGTPPIVKVFVFPPRAHEFAGACFNNGITGVDIIESDAVSPTTYYIIAGYPDKTFPGIPRPKDFR